MATGSKAVSQVTLVTALLNVSEIDAELSLSGINNNNNNNNNTTEPRRLRSFEEYIPLAKDLLQLDVPLIVFAQSKYLPQLQQLYRSSRMDSSNNNNNTSNNTTTKANTDQGDNPSAKNELIQWVPFEVHEMSTWHMRDEIAHCTLPHNAHPQKDTRGYMLMQLEKSAFVKRAVDLNPFQTSHFAWVDTGIYHLCNNDRIKKRELTDVLQRICSNSSTSTSLSLPQNQRIRIPGCWSTSPLLQLDFETLVQHKDDSFWNSVQWYFCGGFFVGPAALLVSFAEVVHQEIVNLVRTLRHLCWEVNVWSVVYAAYPNWFDVYSADHNLSMFVNFFSVNNNNQLLPPQDDDEKFLVCEAAVSDAGPQKESQQSEEEYSTSTDSASNSNNDDKSNTEDSTNDEEDDQEEEDEDEEYNLEMPPPLYCRLSNSPMAMLREQRMQAKAAKLDMEVHCSQNLFDLLRHFLDENEYPVALLSTDGLLLHRRLRSTTVALQQVFLSQGMDLLVLSGCAADPQQKQPRFSELLRDTFICQPIAVDWRLFHSDDNALPQLYQCRQLAYLHSVHLVMISRAEVQAILKCYSYYTEQTTTTTDAQETAVGDIHLSTSSAAAPTGQADTTYQCFNTLDQLVLPSPDSVPMVYPMLAIEEISVPIMSSHCTCVPLHMSSLQDSAQQPEQNYF
jgi:hypothetical protein